MKGWENQGRMDEVVSYKGGGKWDPSYKEWISLHEVLLQESYRKFYFSFHTSSNALYTYSKHVDNTLYYGVSCIGALW